MLYRQQDQVYAIAYIIVIVYCIDCMLYRQQDQVYTIAYIIVIVYCIHYMLYNVHHPATRQRLLKIQTPRIVGLTTLQLVRSSLGLQKKYPPLVTPK